MAEDVRLKEIVTALSKNNEVDNALGRSEIYVRQGGGKKAHDYLCVAVLQGSAVHGREKACSRLLCCLGPAQALLVTYNCASRVSIHNAQWLAEEMQTLLDDYTLTSLLYEECCKLSSDLTPVQEQLLHALTHLPDCLANQLGSSLPSFFHPLNLFSSLARGLLGCLHKIHTDLKGGKDRSLAFTAALMSKMAVLGHAETTLSLLVPTLISRTSYDPLWGRVSCSLFSRVSSSSLDPLLTAVVQLASPSLATPHPLFLLLGNLTLTNHKARFILTHKLWVSRLPSNQTAVYNLIGYLLSWEEGQIQLRRSLQSAIEIWSDGACVRRMESQHHLWLCKLLVLGTTCLASHMTTATSSALQNGVMRGLQVHLESSVPGVRVRGMAAGQCLMNCLHSTPTDQQLHFDLGESSDVTAILQLARPLSEQQQDLEATALSVSVNPVNPVRRREREGGEGEGKNERVSDRTETFGSGMVSVVEASESDSDNELEPFDMSHDPDHTHSSTPHYIRDCLSALVSASDRELVERALTTLPTLIAAEPPDLSEVCLEMAKVLLHLHDNWDMPAFPSLRHTALVALTTTRPHLLAPYLTTEFYSPNHNTRQRLDILEVLSSAATELSHVMTSTQSPPTPQTHEQSKQPWQQLIDERVRAKTRMISKGPQKPPSSPTPSKFSPVAPLFFFPLMAPYDQALPTLDLLGRDSMLLGHLVQTLGNVVWCACHSPSEPVMARTLLEFVWALRYHSSSFVRQAVLCAINMVVVATPTNFLQSDMHEALAEALLWVKDVCSADGCDDVRTLADHTLSLLMTASV